MSSGQEMESVLFCCLARGHLVELYCCYIFLLAVMIYIICTSLT